MTAADAQVAADFSRTLRQEGRDLATPDLLIGAACVHLDLPLVTRNVGHFERIPGIKLVPPDKALERLQSLRRPDT